MVPAAPARPLPDELLRLLDVIRPNSHEAETLTGVKVHDRASARQAADQLLSRGVGAVAVAGFGSLALLPQGAGFSGTAVLAFSASHIVSNSFNVGLPGA